MFQRKIVKTLSGNRIKIIIIFFFLILSGCVAQLRPEEITPPQVLKPSPFAVEQIAVEPRIFNPTKDEIIHISFSLTGHGKAIIMIFDHDMHLINDLITQKIDPGMIETIMWDGRDLEGRIVPDGDYFFTIEAITEQGDSTFYDPTTISGGEYITPEVKFDSKDKNINYELTEDACISIRAGIKSSALLKNILNWDPKLAGKHKIFWDGKNSSGTINLYKQKGFNLMAEAVTSPENSLISKGNSEYTYYEYKTLMAPDRPKKKNRPLFQSQMTLPSLPMQGGPRAIVPEPKFYIKLPDYININEKGLPLLSGSVPLKIVLDKKLKRITTEQRYEIIYFVDFQFVTEEESGYSPYTWVWETQNVSNGEHIVTINIYTLKGGKSSESLKVVVAN